MQAVPGVQIQEIKQRLPVPKARATGDSTARHSRVPDAPAPTRPPGHSPRPFPCLPYARALQISSHHGSLTSAFLWAWRSSSISS